jgi:CRISPR-associated endonuclease Cas2
MRSQAYIVAYDITHPRRRARAAKYLEARGQRVQKSVFVCKLTAAGSRRPRKALERIIDKDDQLMIEPVAGRAFSEPQALIL